MIVIMGLLFAIVFLFLAVMGIVGMILFVVGLLKRKANAKKEIPIKSSNALTGIGIILMLPVTAIIITALYIQTRSEFRNQRNMNDQIKHGTAAEVERLLKQGVSPDCEWGNYDKNIVAAEGKYTILCSLCQNTMLPDNAEKIELLLQYGADIDRAVYRCDYTPQEHLGKVYEREHGCNDNCGRTALMFACQSGNVRAVRMLLEYGANANAVDYCRDTPLIYTVQPGQTNRHDARQRADILRMLLEHGADKTLRGKYSGSYTTGEQCHKYAIRNIGFDSSVSY